MSEPDESSVDLPPSSLSHKELRMICLDNDCLLYTSDAADE